MTTIAVDMDNVLADLEAHYITWYEKHIGLRLRKDDLNGIPEGQAFPDQGAVRRFLQTPDFFRTAPVMEGAIEAMSGLIRDFDVYIVSAAMEFPQSLPEKYDWLREHFPFISWKKFIFCGDKQKIGTDVMIDDHLKNLNHFRGKGILFTACHNINIAYPVRVNNWRQATSYLYESILKK